MATVEQDLLVASVPAASETPLTPLAPVLPTTRGREEEWTSLPPFPHGWFCVAFSHELSPGKVLGRTFMGQQVALFRTASGQVGALDAYCSHLGAHLVHAGGAVVGESIRCPFHGFCFDRAGTCVATGYNTPPPPRARQATWPVREVNGLILLFHGGQPTWEVPRLDTRGWLPLRTRTFQISSHPQETTENGVDLGHLGWVHGYEAVQVLSELTTEGPLLTVEYAMTRPVDLLGRKGGPFSAPIRSEFRISAYGLGYSQVDVRVPQFHLRTRFFVCATPVAPGRIEHRVAQSMKRLEQPARVNPLLALTPRRLAEEAVAAMLFRGFLRDQRQDFPMWHHKKYLHRPALAQGDGPIMRYRLWARQFYG